MMTFDPDKMIAELEHCEGVRLHVYDDATGHDIQQGDRVVGHPTIGAGRCLDRHGITLAESRSMLMNDVATYQYELSGYPWFTGMDAVRQRAIINMRHQLGLSGLLGFPHMILAISRHDWADAYAAGLSSHWAEQTPARARMVMLQLLHGDDLVTAVAV